MCRLMTLNELKYITTVAEKKSFSKASDYLFVAQPTLSQVIARVEKYYNCSFFDRTPKGLEITQAGETYLKYAYSMLSAHQQMELDLKEYSIHIMERLSIGTLINHGIYFFPQTIDRIKEEYPNLTITITEENDTDHLEKLLLHGDIDIAVMRLPIKNPNIEYTVLGSEPIVIMMNRNNPFAKAGYYIEGYDIPFIDITLLADEYFLVFPNNDSVARAVNPIFENAGFFPKKTLEIRSIELHEELCANNNYISVLSKPIWGFIGNNPNITFFNIENRYSVPFSLAVATARKNLPRHIKDYVNLVMQFNEVSLREYMDLLTDS